MRDIGFVVLVAFLVIWFSPGEAGTVAGKVVAAYEQAVSNSCGVRP